MQNKIELYQTEGGTTQVEVTFEGETVWLSQKMMAELFSVNVPAISKHLKNIFESGELNDKEVISILETTTHHGAIKGKTQTRMANYYNLDAIIAVGYRINSIRGTRFRQWATQRLKDYLVEGYATELLIRMSVSYVFRFIASPPWIVCDVPALQWLPSESPALDRP